MSWKNLHLTEKPYMKGDRVKEAQNLLAHNKYGKFYAAAVDGQFGPLSDSATKLAKRDLGYAKKDINGTFGPHLYGYLKGTEKLPLANQIRRKARLAAANGESSKRSRIVAELKWGIAHTASIHYAQIRPMPLKAWKAHKLPLTTDCSGSITCAYYSAGADDPNGLKYNGQGYTGTMLTHLPHIHASQAKPGDLIVFGAYPGAHVCAILETGADPLLFSHGQEAGPFSIRMSVEHAAHRNGPVTYLRGVK
jgi:hypothetical protein